MKKAAKIALASIIATAGLWLRTGLFSHQMSGYCKGRATHCDGMKQGYDMSIRDMSNSLVDYINLMTRWESIIKKAEDQGYNSIVKACRENIKFTKEEYAHGKKLRDAWKEKADEFEKKSENYLQKSKSWKEFTQTLNPFD